VLWADVARAGDQIDLGVNAALLWEQRQPELLLREAEAVVGGKPKAGDR
jgi:hypothetical protein